MITTNNQPITGGAAIVAALVENGVDTVFGLPGAQMYPLFDALHGQHKSIATITTRHEQAAAYMAFGYAKSTGKPGVFSVVPGPGVLNTTAALCTAWGASVPVLCLTGQVPSEFLGRGRGHLHELPDQLATLRTLTKWAARIDRPADAPRAVNAAFQQMLSGRPGPASLEMAWDIMASREPVTIEQAAKPAPAPPPDPDAIERAARILVDAHQPMIMVGGGAQHASAAVLALAEELGAPVTAFRGGRGIVSEDHGLGASSYAGFLMWAKTDALIGIGSRLEMPYMRWANMMTLIDRPQAPPHLIRIDIDPLEMGRLKPHVGIVADAAEAAEALSDAVRKLRKGSRPRAANAAARKRIATAKLAAHKAVQQVQPQAGYLAVIRQVLPRDGFFVEELCQAGFASYFAFPVYEPRSYVSSGFQGTLGFGFQTALGVKVAHPDRAVVSISGDGGFLFGVQELATAAQYAIGVISIVFNNSSYGNVRRDQQERFEGHLIGADLLNPDFVRLAESFGVAGYRVTSPQDLKPVLERAIADNKPALIEVVIERGTETSPWPFIHTGVAPPPGSNQ